MSRKGNPTSRTASPATLGERIRRVRKGWGWSQDRLAKALGTDQQVVSYWERDQMPPSRAFMKLILDLFRLPEAAMVDGKGFSIPDAPAEADDLAVALLQGLERLPAVPEPGLTLVDLAKGRVDHPSVTKALEAMREARNEGLNVLVVVLPAKASQKPRGKSK